MTGGAGTAVAKVAGVFLAGLVVTGLLFPVSRVDINPVQCLSVFGYGVACDTGWSLAAGAATTGVASLLLWLRNRGR
jgi:hypothetical protein